MKRFVIFTLVIIAIMSMLIAPANAACMITEQFEVRIEQTYDPSTIFVDLIGRNEFAGYVANYSAKEKWSRLRY